MGLVGILVAVGVVILSLYLAGVFSPAKDRPELPQDGWWGRGAKDASPDTTIREFKVQVTEETLVDLKRRLDNARLGEDLEKTSFDYGFQVNYMTEVLEYWKTKYDWRKQESLINSFPQFKTNIEGIDIHFIRVKPVSNG